MRIAFTKKDLNTTAWFSLEKLIHLIAGIYIVPKIFNTLGTIDIGKLKFVESVLGMFVPLFGLGLASVCVREIVFKPQKSNQIITTALSVRLVTWLFIAIGFTCYLTLTKNSSLFSIYAILILGYLFKLSDVFEYLLLAKKLAKYIFIGKTTSLLCVLLLQYYGVTNNLNVSFFALIITIDFLLQGVFFIVFLIIKKELFMKQWRFSKRLAKDLLFMAFPLIVSEALIMFYIGIDELFLKSFHGDHANGIFASVQFLVIGLSWTLGFAIINAIYPSLAESYHTNRNNYYIKSKQLLFSLIILGISLAVVYMLFGNKILETHFSKQYADAKTALHIFCWAPLFVFIGMIYEKHLLNANRLNHNVYRFALGCLVNIVLCYTLIPKYQVNGAAIAVLISHFITNIGYVAFDKKTKKEIIFLRNTK
ncbi:flippase [Corallibacter sp.]|uniref:flippase n=1 Tax=Corallibacter sp. TaxID=2038084 RepID=UPI003A8D8089